MSAAIAIPMRLLGACALLICLAAATDEPPRSAKARAALERHARAAAEAGEAYDTAMADADRRLRSELDEALKAAMKAGDLDEANRIKGAVPAEGSGGGARPSGLVGTWDLTYGNGTSRTYTIDETGTLSWLWEGKLRRGRLVRTPQGVTSPPGFDTGKRERYTPLPDGRILAEHFNPDATFPAGPPDEFGVGVRRPDSPGRPSPAAAAAEEAPEAGEAPGADEAAVAEAAGPGAPELPPPSWSVKPGAPASLGPLLKRAEEARQREFKKQLEQVASQERDVEARKAGRIVKTLKDPGGVRAIPAVAGRGPGYHFVSQEVKAKSVVQAEEQLGAARRHLEAIRSPAYLPPAESMPIGALKDGAIGGLAAKVVHVIGAAEVLAEAETRVWDGTGSALQRRTSRREVWVEGVPNAKHRRPGEPLPGLVYEVVGTKDFQTEAGGKKKVPHLRVFDWAQWVRVR